MANMGRYCKAYPVVRFREFSGWSEKLQNLRKDRVQADQASDTTVLGDDDLLYLQENFIATDGIFLDENIIFDSVTPEWKDFCENMLHFQVPDYQRAKAPESDGTSA